MELPNRLEKVEREQSRVEEIANSASHALGFVAALIGGFYLIGNAAGQGHPANPAMLIGVSVFAIAAALLYLASAIYHALPEGAVKERFNRIDHAAIYLLIAGTYTPFTLGALHGAWGWTLLVLIWGMALTGVILKTCRGIRNRALSTGLYLGMGWLIVIAARPLWLHVPRAGLLWLVAGGVAYTLGVVFYNAKHVPFFHLVWHLFVLAGTACHYCAILWYSA